MDENKIEKFQSKRASLTYLQNYKYFERFSFHVKIQKS